LPEEPPGALCGSEASRNDPILIRPSVTFVF
jgi:hypothetical protein